MALNVIRGRRRTAVRGVIYGVEGIGKSTLAASFPGAVVLDTEDGTNHLDVARIPCGDWATLKATIGQLLIERHEFQTVVIDTADWAERSLIEWMLARDAKKSIESYGFGKGYIMLAEEFGHLLTACDKLVARGINVVFVAHSLVKRTTPPDQADGWDRYELKLSRQTSPLLREWCDLLLFANYETKLVETDGGRKRAIGGKTRVLHTERSAAFDAKNRFGLPERIPMTVEALGDVFTPPAPQSPGWLARVQAATTVEELGRIGDDADAADLTPQQRKKLEQAIAARHEQIEPEDDGQEHHDAADAEAEAMS